MPMLLQRAAQALFFLACAIVMALAVAELGHKTTFPFADKLQHALVFFVLAALAEAAWPRALRRAMAGVFLYGLLIESVQWFLPWREFSLLDWLADGVGVALWLLVAQALRPRLRGFATRHGPAP
jgi:VanZ family protein